MSAEANGTEGPERHPKKSQKKMKKPLDKLKNLCYNEITKEINKEEHKMTWYCFTFADGYQCWCAGLSRQEMGREVRQHGKLVSKVRI